MNRISQNIFNYLIEYIGFEEYKKFNFICQHTKKRILKNKNYLLYKFYLKNAIDEHESFDRFLLNRSIILEDKSLEDEFLKYIIHFFYDINYIKNNSSLSLYIDFYSPPRIFYLLKKIYEIGTPMNLKNVELIFYQPTELESFFEWCVLLCEKSKLETLEIDTLNNFGILESVLYLIYNCNTKLLRLKNLTLDLNSLLIIENAILENKYIETLKIENMVLEGDSQNYLTNIIQNNKRIKNFEFINSLNRNNTEINIFSIFTFKITKTNLNLMMDSLQNNNFIESLNLEQTKDLDAQPLIITNLLMKNNFLKVLNLSRCKLSSYQIKLMSNGLINNKSLEELNLSHNPIDSEGFLIILKAISYDINPESKLEKLIMKDTLICNKSDSNLANLLNNQKIPNLKYLDISGCKFLKNLFFGWETFLNLEVLKCSTVDYESYKNLLSLLSTCIIEGQCKLNEFSILFYLKNNNEEFSKLNLEFYSIVKNNFSNPLKNLTSLSMNFFIDNNIAQSLKFFNLSKLNLENSIIHDSHDEMNVLNILTMVIINNKNLTHLSLNEIYINKYQMYEFISEIVSNNMKIQSLFIFCKNIKVSTNLLELFIYSSLKEFSVNFETKEFQKLSDEIIKNYFMTEKKNNFKNYKNFNDKKMLVLNSYLDESHIIENSLKDKINIKFKYL